MLLWLITVVLAIFGGLSLATYLIPVLLQLLNKEQNLKEKYGSWAVVTGASSGIGLAITEKLARQGVSVVMVALDDDLLRKESERVRREYPAVTIVSVGADLGAEGYLPKVEEATKDKDIRMVFCNAGYLVPGLFANPAQPASRQLANLECNLGSAVRLSRHFVSGMLSKVGQPYPGRRRGLVAFTSSSAGFLPNPLSILYSSTKAFLTNFACGLAGEVRHFGVDVIVIHPSPIASRFATGQDMLGPVKASMNIAKPPSVIAEDLFANAGRAVVRDSGWVTVLMKIMVKAVDFNFLAELFPWFVPLSGDFKVHKEKLLAATKKE